MTAAPFDALPPLHVVTDDSVLARPELDRLVTELFAAGGAQVALHVRGPSTPGRTLERIAGAALESAGDRGGRVVVNDRVDVALAVGAGGAQLATHSIPLDAARRIAPELPLGVSVHDGANVDAAVGADWLVAGTIWDTPSHPSRAGGGLDHLRALVARSTAPVVAIGGVTPERVRSARDAGARGVAVLRGVWEAPDPARALERYLSAWRDA